jgi:capsular exopolysaccharide synthesis family protein
VSRNFDILHREDAGATEFRPVPVPAPHTNASSRGRDRGSAVEDEITKLVQRVFIFSSLTKAPKVVAFCGVDQGSGCSWVCARVSEVLAEQTSARICVIDANLRSPSLHEHFHIERATGFADAMRDSRPAREFARATAAGNLWLLTSGAVGKEPNGALHPARLRIMFSDLRNDFDYLLVDTPPMSVHADATLLAQLTDGVVLVVSSNSTRRETARAAKESLQTAKIPILGAVLNRRTYPIPQALYQRL